MTGFQTNGKKTNRLRNDVDDLYSILATVENDVKTIRTDVTTLQNDITTLRAVVDEHSVVLADHGKILALHGNKLDHIIGLLEAS